MKLIIRNILLIFALVFWSCTSTEEPISVQSQPYKRISQYDTLSTDFTTKYISKYYFNFDKYLIVDPDSSDYWYNFSSSYKTIVGIDAPDKQNAEIGVKMLDELLIKWYDASFVKTHFPKSIIVGKNVYTYSTNASTQVVTKIPTDLYNGAYFLLVKAQNFDTMSVLTKKQVALNLQTALWSNITKYRPFLNIDDRFYSYGVDKSLYSAPFSSNEWTGGRPYDPNEFITKQKVYSQGFVTYEKEFALYFGKPYISKVTLPDKVGDLSSWINFVLTYTDSEVQAIKVKYGLIGTAINPTQFETKYNYIVKAFTDAGLDYRNLGYKPAAGL